MTNNEAFFARKQPAAVFKHAILSEYATVFAQMMNARTGGGPSWIIDGYAGAGAYQDQATAAGDTAGSPLVILRSAESKRSQFQLRSIFIEENRGLAARLRGNVAPFVARGLVADVLEGDAADRLPEALVRVGDAPVVTFLDPFGASLAFDSLAETLLPRSRAHPSEVLINLSVGAVGRNGGLLTTRPDGTVVPRPGNAAAVERVDRFLGGHWWREVFSTARGGGLEPTEAAEVVMEGYRRRVGLSTGCEAVAVPVRRRPGHKPLFHLTLFHRSPVASFVFLDAAERANRRWRQHFKMEDLEALPDTLFGRQYEADQVEQHFQRAESAQHREMVDLVKRRSCDLLEGSDSLAMGDVFTELIGAQVSLIGCLQVRHAWRELNTEGRARYEPRKSDREAVLRRPSGR